MSKMVEVTLQIELEDDPDDNVVSPEELNSILEELKNFVLEDLSFVVESVDGSIKVR